MRAEPGSEIQSPMAVVILGGILTATLLNLLVIPGVYRLMTVKKQENPLGKSAFSSPGEGK